MIAKPDLILASASSRRCKLLNQLDIHYDTRIPAVDESSRANENVYEYVQRIARSKADVIWFDSNSEIPVLAADTVIVLDKTIIGKPEDQCEAEQRLHSLSGREHQVVTAVCLCTKEGTYQSMISSTVKFKAISLNEIATYCATCEPYDKAGAYGIQGLAASFVEYFSGSYTAVMGLPLRETCNLFKQANLY